MKSVARIRPMLFAETVAGIVTRAKWLSVYYPFMNPERFNEKITNFKPISFIKYSDGF